MSALLSGAPAVALAQDGASADKATDSTVVIVSAQKRKENIRDVPLSISVLSADKLQKSHIEDYADLSRAVPGLSFTNTGNSGLSRITLRGISSSQGAATVGIYLNDVSLTIPNQFFTGVTLPRLFDLDHVEVLRGPQGTLYGDSSLGGTLRFITAQPKLGRFEASVSGDTSFTQGGGLNGKADGMVNLPLGDKTALRLAAESEYQSGFVDHVDANGNVDNKNVNSERTNAVRATLLFTPDATLKITPSIQWQQTNAADTGIFDTSLPKFEESKTVREPSRDTMYAPSLTIEKAFGGYNLTSVTAYTYRQFKRQFDATIYDSEYIAGTLDPSYGSKYDAIASLPGVFPNTDTVKTFSQELRLGSPSIKASGKPYEWQLGVYYQDQKVRSLDDEYVVGLTAAAKALYGDTLENLIGYDAPNDLLGYFHSDRHLTQYAIFAEGSYLLTSKLKATLGLRQISAKSTYVMHEGGWLADSTPGVDTAESKDSPLTPKFALTYTASSNVNLYTNVSKGFRLGGQNNALPSYCSAAITSLGLSTTGSKSYAPDSLWSYELGAKTRWFGNRLTFNGSLYTIDWDNIQQSLSLSSCGYVITANAGKARSQGGEFDMSARLTDALSLSVSGGVTDAHITQAAKGSSASDGQKVLGVPDKTMTVGLDYYRPVGANTSAFASLDWTYTGKSYGSFKVTNSDYRRPSYQVVNLNLGFDYKDISVSLYAKNLMNDQTIIQKPSVLFITQGLTIEPRTIGVSLSKHF